jgi:hypothetical protein
MPAIGVRAFPEDASTPVSTGVVGAGAGGKAEGAPSDEIVAGSGGAGGMGGRGGDGTGPGATRGELGMPGQPGFLRLGI